MNLSEVSKNTKATIVSINAPMALKKRLFSLGLSNGKEVEVLEKTIQNNTIKVAVGQGLLALRFNEAKSIDVECKL